MKKRNASYFFSVFFLYFFNCNITYKITVKFKIIITYFLLISDFKSYIIIERHKKNIRKIPNFFMKIYILNKNI
jgi:hypothetical protein